MNLLIKNSPQELSKDYRAGLTSYIEDASLHEDIENAVSRRHVLHRIKALNALHEEYSAPLSHGHIDYYIKQQKKAVLNRILGTICILLIAAYSAFALYKINGFYQYYHDLDVSDSTFQKAVDYYEKGEYSGAALRFQTLYEHEWNSTASAHYLSSIYQAQDNYDAAAEILLDCLEVRYGLVNISTDNTLYAELRDIYVNKPLSQQKAEEVSFTLDRISGYTAAYAQLFYAISRQDYEDAAYLCESLKSACADGYYFVSCYANVLVNTGRTADACKLIMQTVRDDSTPQMRMISARQRISLVNYVLPYLNGQQQADCNAFLSNELAALQTVSDSDSAEPFLPYEDIEYLFIMHNGISCLQYQNPLDRITVNQKTLLIDGKEVYSIEFHHYDGDRIASEYFFMDMKQNIYIFKDGRYVFLPTDEPSNPPAELEGTVVEHYRLCENPDILLDYQYDQDQNTSYTIKNTSSGEIIFSGEPAGCSTNGAFAYIEKGRACLTVFLSENDAVILVTKDPEQKYSDLEGRYQREP